MQFSSDANNARIVRPAGNKLGKLCRVQNACENFYTINNTRSRSREIRTGVHDINFAALRCGKRIESWKSPKDFIVAPRAINIVPAKRKHDDVRTSIQHFLPPDLDGRLVFTS